MKKIVLYDTETFTYEDLPERKTHWSCKWSIVIAILSIVTILLIIGIPNLKTPKEYEEPTTHIQANE